MNDEVERDDEQRSPAGDQTKGKAKRPSITVSKFILVLGGIVVILLIIVNDSVTVDRLVSEISSLDSTQKEMSFSNDSLQAELRKLSSAERITRIASEKLGLVYSSQTLDEIAIDKDKLDDARRRDARDTTK
jgi:cell division protein FtsL